MTNHANTVHYMAAPRHSVRCWQHEPSYCYSYTIKHATTSQKERRILWTTTPCLLTWRYGVTAILSTGKYPNIQAPTLLYINIPTPATRLSLRAYLEWNTVQPPSRRLVPEAKLCIEASSTTSNPHLWALHTSSGSFPTREVTFHRQLLPEKASF